MAGCERMSRTGAHGWNVDYSAHAVETVSTVLRGVEHGSRSGVSGTLLGPEGTAVMVVALVLPVLLEMRFGVLRVGDWSLFENCTVDASICGQVFKGARWMPWH